MHSGRMLTARLLPYGGSPYLPNRDPLDTDPPQWRIQDIPEEGVPTPQGGANIRFCQIFPKNCMKFKEFGCPGGRASLASPLRSATAPGQRPPDRDPLTETPLDRDPLRQRPPKQRPSQSCDLWCMLGQRPPL